MNPHALRDRYYALKKAKEDANMEFEGFWLGLKVAGIPGLIASIFFPPLLLILGVYGSVTFYLWRKKVKADCKLRDFEVLLDDSI